MSLNATKNGNGSSAGERAFCAFVENDISSKKESNDLNDIADLWKYCSVCWIDYISDDLEKDSLKVAEIAGFSESLVTSLLKNKRSGYEDFGHEMGILLPAITVDGFDVKLSPLLILIRKNLIFTLHTTEIKRFFRLRRYAETFMKKLPPNMLDADKVTLILARLVDENNSRNFEHLLEIEEQGDKMSERLANPETPRSIIGRQIHEMKHALITYLGGLWATVDVLSSVRYGDADLLSDDYHILDKITALMEEVNSQIGLAEHLSEVLASGLEVVQSIYNNQLQILNNRLALLVSYLTIIGTALLVPNTIATAMGSSMFNFGPQDLKWYIPLLVISTVVSTWIAWYVVKKMNLLPKKPYCNDSETE